MMKKSCRTVNRYWFRGDRIYCTQGNTKPQSLGDVYLDFNTITGRTAHMSRSIYWLQLIVEFWRLSMWDFLLSIRRPIRGQTEGAFAGVGNRRWLDMKHGSSWNHPWMNCAPMTRSPMRITSWQWRVLCQWCSVSLDRIEDYRWDRDVRTNRECDLLIHIPPYALPTERMALVWTFQRRVNWTPGADDGCALTNEKSTTPPTYRDGNAAGDDVGGILGHLSKY